MVRPRSAAPLALVGGAEKVSLVFGIALLDANTLDQWLVVTIRAMGLRFTATLLGLAERVVKRHKAPLGERLLPQCSKLVTLNAPDGSHCALPKFGRVCRGASGAIPPGPI